MRSCFRRETIGVCGGAVRAQRTPVGKMVAPSTVDQTSERRFLGGGGKHVGIPGTLSGHPFSLRVQDDLEFGLVWCEGRGEESVGGSACGIKHFVAAVDAQRRHWCTLCEWCTGHSLGGPAVKKCAKPLLTGNLFSLRRCKD